MFDPILPYAAHVPAMTLWWSVALPLLGLFAPTFSRLSPLCRSPQKVMTFTRQGNNVFSLALTSFTFSLESIGCKRITSGCHCVCLRSPDSLFIRLPREFTQLSIVYPIRSTIPKRLTCFFITPIRLLPLRRIFTHLLSNYGILDQTVGRWGDDSEAGRLSPATIFSIICCLLCVFDNTCRCDTENIHDKGGFCEWTLRSKHLYFLPWSAVVF